MFLKQRKASTEPRLRSLLQKAVRRGHVDVVRTTIRRLYDLGDKTWLRSRAAVITFEESWPLAENLKLERGEASKTDALINVTSAEKQKDAAGLGSLAYAYHEGDKSVEQHVDDLRSVRMVSEALERPQEFLAWAATNALADRERGVVIAARRYLSAATWGWDKTCILAAALLASTKGAPSLQRYEAAAQLRFPYWVALDKHTPQGKDALRRVASRLGVSYRQIIWAEFYFESAVTNAMAPSVWWEVEKTWRLGKAGLSVGAAAALWESARPLLQQELEADVKGMLALLSSRETMQADLLE